MTLDLLSKLNASDQFSSTFLRYRGGGSDEPLKKLKEEHRLKLAMPNLYDEQLPLQTTDYERALERIYYHRQKLFTQLKRSEAQAAAATSDDDADTKYQQFYDKLSSAVEKAKLSRASLNSHLAECQKLNDINKELLPVLVDREQHLGLFKLLREVCHSVRSLESTCPNVKRDYKKMQIEALLNQTVLIRKQIHRIVANFNVFLRSKMETHSPIHHHLYKLTNLWKDRVEDLVEEMYVWSFDLIKWPSITLEDIAAEKAMIDTKQMALFCEMFRCLLELQTGEFRPNGVQLGDNLVCKLDLFQPAEGISGHVPIKMMAVPLIKRFNYHFLNDQSKLNSIENPEWFLCQVEQWITRNESFLSRTIDPILEEYYGPHCKNSKFQLTCHLLDLVKIKLETDASKLTDDRLFSLTLDEVIIFNKQINFMVPGIYEYNPKLNPIRVFFDDDYYFQRFLQLEKNRLNEFVNSIFESDTSWNVIYGTDYTEDNKFIICEAADKFTLLLQNLIERSTFIPSSEYRVRIVDLIIETMDDFRLRLSQLFHVYEERWPFSKKFYAILNTFGFLMALINEWRNNSYFLQILHENKRDQSVFGNLAQTFEHMIEEIFARIENIIIADVTLDIIEYKKLNWHSMSVDKSTLTVSKSGAALIYNMSVKNSTIQKYISSPLFHTFLYDIAAKIQDLFFNRIIMEHYFNKDGAQQLQYDIRSGLFSIFSLYIKNTEYTFSKLSDALVILNCSVDTVRNLQTRYKAKNEIEFKMALRNIGVYSLRPKTVMCVLEKRIGFN